MARQVARWFAAGLTILLSMRALRTSAATPSAFSVYFFGLIMWIMSFITARQEEPAGRAQSPYFWWGGLAIIAAGGVIAVV